MAYFKRSRSNKAAHVCENGHYRFVGEGSGTHLLVRTAKDKQIRKDRDNHYYSSLPIPKVVAIHNLPNDCHQRSGVWTRKEIQHFWWWYDYDVKQMEEAIANKEYDVRYAQARNMETLLLYHKRVSKERAWSRYSHDHRPVTIEGITYYPEASPSYLEYDKVRLVRMQEELRNYKLALRAFKNASVLWTFNGESFSPPYSKVSGGYR